MAALLVCNGFTRDIPRPQPICAWRYLQVLADNPAKPMRSAPASEARGMLPDAMEMHEAVCSLSSALGASECQYLHTRWNESSFQQLLRLCVAAAGAANTACPAE